MGTAAIYPVYVLIPDEDRFLTASVPGDLDYFEAIDLEEMEHRAWDSNLIGYTVLVDKRGGPCLVQNSDLGHDAFVLSARRYIDVCLSRGKPHGFYKRTDPSELAALVARVDQTKDG